MQSVTSVDRFGEKRYVIRRKVFTLFGAAFHVYDAHGNVVLYSEQKAFKLREDIRLYNNAQELKEVLTIRARQVLDFGATYDVHDPRTGGKVGALRRRGLRSLLRDEWAILDATDTEIGMIQEESQFLALIRRFVLNLVPQKFVATIGGIPVGIYRQSVNPFVLKIKLDFSMDPQRIFDRRLGIAAGILLSAIERRQG